MLAFIKGVDMENKVTIIGCMGSGKTMYLAGMYRHMSGLGCKNYTIGAVDPNQDLYLANMWNGLYKGRFPAATNDSETYTFHIAYHYKSVCDFDWLDYPGGLLSDPNNPQWKKMKESIETADCLLLVLDGEKFQIEAEDKEDYKKKLKSKLIYDSGIRDEIKEFNCLSQKSIRIPPVCLLITKCDLINRDYKESIESALQEVLSGLFASTPLGIITGVSLGENIRENGPKPWCLEEPIAFAVLTILLKYMVMLRSGQDDQRDVIERNRGWFQRWRDREQIELARQTLEKLAALGNKWKEDAYMLLDLFDSGKVVYVHGQNRNFREYIPQFMSEILDG